MWVDCKKDGKRAFLEKNNRAMNQRFADSNDKFYKLLNYEMLFKNWKFHLCT
jgi:hypothetical protein